MGAYKSKRSKKYNITNESVKHDEIDCDKIPVCSHVEHVECETTLFPLIKFPSIQQPNYNFRPVQFQYTPYALNIYSTSVNSQDKGEFLVTFHSTLFF
ncbi:unnamed protein product [Brachionus calyciflorus]|uniref:Uncharacterized protein n=1 Tax=Brachionus calyciflorus TaxID=104777 RepID=A0A813P166_9BILA|nr:unnamed protein product [Brachionus calyciflorus]